MDKENQDKIYVLENDIINSASVYNLETKLTGNVYDLSKIDSVDKYDIYLSGASGLVIIENKKANFNKELVVFRDSFGSSITPLMIDGYEKITLVDTRYLASKYLKDYVDFENSDILFLYSTTLINNSTVLK